MPVAEKDIWDGAKSKALTAKQRKLRTQHKQIADQECKTFEKLNNEHKKRCKLLELLKLNVKKAHKINFRIWIIFS